MFGLPRTKVIRRGGLPVDTSDYPFELEVQLRQPEAASFAVLMAEGSTEYVVIRGRSLRSVRRALTRHGLDRHPRLRRYTITGPEGVIEES